MSIDNFLKNFTKAIYNYYEISSRFEGYIPDEYNQEWFKICNEYSKMFDKAEEMEISDEIQISCINKVKAQFKIA